MEDFVTYFPSVFVYLLDMCPYLRLEKNAIQRVIYLDVKVTDCLQGDVFISVLKKWLILSAIFFAATDTFNLRLTIKD